MRLSRFVAGFGLVCLLFLAAIVPSTTRAQEVWAQGCGDGRIDRVVDTMESALPWAVCCTHNNAADVTLSVTTGCSGQAVSINYDLNGPYPAGAEWLVVRRPFDPVLDFSAATHVRLGIKALNANAHHNLQIKLVDQNGRVDWYVVESATDIPAWRTLYIDVRSFTCFGAPAACSSRPPLDLSRVTEIQFGIGRCLRDIGSGIIECDAGSQDTNALVIDEIAVVDLRPGAPHRLASSAPETIVANPAIRAFAAAVLRDRQVFMGLAPAWYEEGVANYNTYSQAVRILVLLQEFRLTKVDSYRIAAEEAVAAMLALQRSPATPNAGAWFTAYERSGTTLVPRDGCSGNETATHDVDRCFWVGNTAWMMTALQRARDAGVGNPATVKSALDSAADWMLTLRGRLPDYLDVVTYGVEGNVSAYFGLAAAGRASAARTLGEAIFKHAWDPVEQRMKIGVLPNDLDTALDVAGSWGPQMLRCLRRDNEARASQAYVASMFRTTSFDGSRDGYGDVRGPWTMTVEFGAQAAAAGMPGSQHVMSEIHLLQAPDGSFPGSTDSFSGGGAWTTTWHGIASTGWVYFAHAGNPLEPCPVTGLRIQPGP